MERTTDMKATAKSAQLAPYERVKQHILQRIQNGEWTAGMQLPSEPELVESLGVSRMTVHRALRELSSDGLLSRIQGSRNLPAAAANTVRSFPGAGYR